MRLPPTAPSAPPAPPPARPREERYYGHDARGSNRSVTDERGHVAGTQSFDPWGVPDAGKHAGNKQGITLLTELFGYTGERQDGWTGHSEQAGQTGQIGVVYLRARWLHPHYGRFLSPDPYAGALDRPLSQNDYAYTENNPVSATDPTGLSLDDVFPLGGDGFLGTNFYGIDPPSTAFEAFRRWAEEYLPDLGSLSDVVFLSVAYRGELSDISDVAAKAAIITGRDTECTLYGKCLPESDTTIASNSFASRPFQVRSEDDVFAGHPCFNRPPEGDQNSYSINPLCLGFQKQTEIIVESQDETRTQIPVPVVTPGGIVTIAAEGSSGTGRSTSGAASPASGGGGYEELFSAAAEAAKRGGVAAITEVVRRGSTGSERLANELQRYVVRPAQTAAHHIVAFEHPSAEEARQVLAKFGININSAANGVFLRQNPVSIAPGAYHPELGNNAAYYSAVNTLITSATSRLEVVEALDVIRRLLLANQFVPATRS